MDGNVKKVLKEVELGEAKLEELMAVIEPDVGVLTRVRRLVLTGIG